MTMIVRTFFRAIISLAGATLPLLFLSGSYSPLGSYLPNLLNLFGKESSLGNLLGIQITPVLPVVAAYAALGLLAVLLVVRQDRKRSTNGPIPS